jgi:hypothetical protein
MPTQVCDRGACARRFPAKAALASLAVLRCPTISLAMRLCTQPRMLTAVRTAAARWASSAKM